MELGLYLILLAIVLSALMVGFKAFRSGLLPTLFRGAPYLATNTELVKVMLRLTAIQPTDVVLDLGSGDGRLVLAAAEAGARQAIGYEIDPVKVAYSRRSAERQHLPQATFFAQSFWSVSWADADVVFIYSLPFYMEAIDKKLRKDLKTGARVVTLIERLPGWPLLAEEEGVRVYRKE